MSVHGEFERYARALIQSLRATGAADDSRRASSIEAAALASNEPLESRANALLEIAESTGKEGAEWPPEAVESATRLLQITHIILGL